MTHQTKIRVRYSETDQMSYVYYGNYAAYYEVGRVEFLRDSGFSYKTLEDMGIMMPVVEINIKFIRPAKYDDLLTINSEIESYNEKRIFFRQFITNETGKIVNDAKIELAFIDAQTFKAINMPQFLEEIFKPLVRHA